jgi:sporulation protein YlmC with PRC-barrel domain
MPHYGILREYKLEEVDDVRGAEVYGVNDEKLGTIDDVIFDHSNGEIRYIVLKTGGLLGGKRIMVPSNRIEPYGNHEDKFYAELDKDRLEMLPEFNDEKLKSEGGWADFEKQYEERWNDGAVMYNKDTGRIITPAPDETVQQGSGRPLSQQAKESLNRDFTPQRMGKRDELLGVGDSGTGKTTLQPQKPSIAGRESVAGQNTSGQSAGQQNVSSHAGQSSAVQSNAVQSNVRQSNIGQEIADRQNLGQSSAGRQNLSRESGRRDVNSDVPGETTREVEGVMGTEFQVSSSPASSPTEAMREPGVYRLDPVPEAGQNASTKNRDVTEAPNEALNAKYGRRWTQFQQSLRDRRDKVISGCNLCGTQDKAA